MINPLISSGAEVIIGTELGVWRSQNFDTASPTWTRSDNGMRAVTVVDLDLRTSDNVVLATTHGRGFFTGEFLSGTLTTAEIQPEKQFNIYPTISDGNISLSANENGLATITTFSLAGQQVNNQTINLTKNTTTKVKLSNVASGVYILKIQQNNKIQTQKIVIN